MAVHAGRAWKENAEETSALGPFPGRPADAFHTWPVYASGNANADLNCDGIVNILDLGLLADNFGKSGDL